MRKRLYFEKNKVVYIWPDYPFILCGTIVLDDVIKGFDENNSVEEISKLISLKYDENYVDVLNYIKYIKQAINSLDSKKIIEDQYDKLSMATINITGRCNLHCKHCYAYKENINFSNELSTVELLETISKLNDIITAPPRLLIFSGGEPTLNEEKLIAGIELAYKLGFNVRLNSNGILLSNKLIKTLKKCNVLTQISIDGATAESHALLRGDKKSYQKARDAVKILSSNNCRVRVSMTTHKENFNEIPIVFKQAIQDGAEQFITSNLVITGEAKNNNLSSVPLKEEFLALYNLVKTDVNLQKMTKSTLLAETINAMRSGVKFITCGTGICTCCVDSNGDIFPCINMVNDIYKIGNVKHENSLKELWSSSSTIKNLKKLNVDTMNEKCQTCMFRYFCGGYCRGETIANGQKITDPYIRCKEWQQALLTVLEILCESPDLYNIFDDVETGVLYRE